MSKKGNKQKNKNQTGILSDFTIEDSANASKPVRKLKKSSISAPSIELTWDQLNDENFDIIQESNEDGTTKLVYKKNIQNLSAITIDDESGKIYPEIVWYLISKFINPENVGPFAGINKITYATTKRESFWRTLYSKYCNNQPNLPDYLRLDNNYKSYGLRQRVIRALYHVHKPFCNKVMLSAAKNSAPHLLLKRCCVNMWYSKGSRYWLVYFKFKRRNSMQRHAINNGADIIKELGRVDANSEEGCQVLQITSENFFELPPLMGLTLSLVRVELAQRFTHNRLHLGFNAGVHVSKDILPEYSIVIDAVINIAVYDWWHPRYPHFDNKIPSNMTDETLPMFKKNFF